MVLELEVLSSNSLNFSVISSIDCCLSFLSILTSCLLSHSSKMGGLLGWEAGDFKPSSFHLLITSFIVVLDISKILHCCGGLYEVQQFRPIQTSKAHYFWTFLKKRHLKNNQKFFKRKCQDFIKKKVYQI